MLEFKYVVLVKTSFQNGFNTFIVLYKYIFQDKKHRKETDQKYHTLKLHYGNLWIYDQL